MPHGDIDGIKLSLLQFDFSVERSVKGESPLTYILGIVSQIFESENGFDGAKWPLFPSFEVSAWHGRWQWIFVLEHWVSVTQFGCFLGTVCGVGSLRNPEANQKQ